MIFYIFIVLGLFFNSTAYGEDPQTYNVQVLLNAYKFVPDKLKIKVGDTIVWHNEDERQHKLASVAGSGPTDDLEIFADSFHPGTLYSHTFKEPGEYPYFCFIHNRMTGLITVLGKDK